MELTALQLGLVPIILGIVSALKMAGLSTRYAPIVSLVLGIIIVGLTASFNLASVFIGLVIGLSASGLYSGTKTTLQ